MPQLDAHMPIFNLMTEESMTDVYVSLFPYYFGPYVNFLVLKLIFISIENLLPGWPGDVDAYFIPERQCMKYASTNNTNDDERS